jgi:hypothetical protein
MSKKRHFIPSEAISKPSRLSEISL